MIRRRLAWPLTVVMVATLVSADLAPPLAWAQSRSAPRGVLAVLRATPAAGHSGDILYLSGSGFEPYTHLFLMMGCPNWFVGATTFHNVDIYGRGPTTDANGEFYGYPIRAMPLQGLTRSACQIYTQYGANTFGPDVPASYYIKARGQTLAYCDTHICPTVSPAPRRIRPGLVEHIGIEQGWPGAIADINIVYPGNPPRHIRKTLDWQGAVDVTDRVPARVLGSQKVVVKVHFHFGRAYGDKLTNFMVVR